MACVELCGGVHTAQRPMQFPLDSVHIIWLSVSVSFSVSGSVNEPYVNTIVLQRSDLSNFHDTM